jgi:hypothetical protein
MCVSKIAVSKRFFAFSLVIWVSGVKQNVVIFGLFNAGNFTGLFRFTVGEGGFEVVCEVRLSISSVRSPG